jgi:hypothetical protein
MKIRRIAAIGMALLTVGSATWAQVPGPTIPPPTIPGPVPTIPPVAEEFVACPLKNVATAITTPIPAPWWTTGQSELPLKNVRVDIVGGRNVLRCDYLAAWVGNSTLGVVRHYPTGRTVCRAVPTRVGFLCR